MIDNTFQIEKSGLIKKIKQMQSQMPIDELKEINRLYDKYVTIKKADIAMLKSYTNFISGYIKAKYQLKAPKQW